jgi:hypothetical protein
MDFPALPDNEGLRLRAEYETAARFYAWAVSELSRQRGNVPREEHESLLNLVQHARVECETAREALRIFKNSN